MTNHMLDHKTSLNKFTKTEIILGGFSRVSGIKLQADNRRKTGKFTNMWKLNNTFFNQWVRGEVKKEIRKHFKTKENKSTTHQNLGDA